MTLQQSHRIADAVESLREAKNALEKTSQELNDKLFAMPENVQESALGDELHTERNILYGACSRIDAIIEKISPYYD